MLQALLTRRTSRVGQRQLNRARVGALSLPHSFTTSHLCFYFQTKEPIKNKEGEEIKQTEDEKTKQIYKNWKEDSEWQASCEYGGLRSAIRALTGPST